MKQIVLGIALAALATSAMAADFEPPPPVSELRPATYDWTGPYIGLRASGVSEFGDYIYDCPSCAAPAYAEMDGHGWAAGFTAGYNYQMEAIVLGLEGTWEFGSKVGSNDDVNQMTELEFNHIATLRARAGMAFDDTLVYALGGAAFVKSTFSTSDFPTGSGNSASDHTWSTGFIVGAGIQHAFTDRLSGRLEYTYLGLPNADYELTNTAGTVTIDQDFAGIHTVSVGLDYNFSW
jgi:outer membrane immunogenic protein